MAKIEFRNVSISLSPPTVILASVRAHMLSESARNIWKNTEGYSLRFPDPNSSLLLPKIL